MLAQKYKLIANYKLQIAIYCTVTRKIAPLLAINAATSNFCCSYYCKKRSNAKLPSFVLKSVFHGE